MTCDQAYDIAIVGVRAVGSAAALELSSGVSGFDCFGQPHAFDCSYGHSRISTEAYFEDLIYVPMMNRSFKL